MVTPYAAPPTGMKPSASNYDLLEALADEDLDACCGICIDTMGPGTGSEGEAHEPVCTLPCGHRFHLHCIEHWASYEVVPVGFEQPRPMCCTCARTFTCPTCRAVSLKPASDSVADKKAEDLRKRKGLPTDMGTWDKLRRPYEGVTVYSSETCRCDHNLFYSTSARYRCLGYVTPRLIRQHDRRSLPPPSSPGHAHLFSTSSLDTSPPPRAPSIYPQNLLQRHMRPDLGVLVALCVGGVDRSDLRAPTEGRQRHCMSDEHGRKCASNL